jgi:DNA-binding GntR family transcriptional regulator
LEQEGLVSRTPGGGTTVTSLSRTDVEEICSLRLQLESLAIQLGVTRSNEAQWAELADNIRDTQETTDPQSLAEKDLQFHEKLVRAAGHGRLLASWLTLRSQLRLIMVQRNLADEDSRRATVEGHKDLLRAIRACDAERAVSILRHHLQRQFTWMINSFDVMDRT